MRPDSLLKPSVLRFEKYSKLNSLSFLDSKLYSVLSAFFFLFLIVCSISPVNSAKWVEVQVGEDSGDTFLWPYFYTASRFVDVESINKKDDYVMYHELIDSRRAISSNVLSVIVEKKSRCDGRRVLWEHFSIYKSAMGKGKPIMKLNPNEMEYFKVGSSAFLSDEFVCSLENSMHEVHKPWKNDFSVRDLKTYWK